MLKSLLKEALARDYAQSGKDKIVLEFSGGCDSSALLFAMSELPQKFNAITYHFRQPKSYLKKLKYMTALYQVPLTIVELTEQDVVDNMKELNQRGYTGQVLVDCLAGHLPIIKQLQDCLVVNGSYADALYGSYFYHFKPGMSKEDFDAKRRELISKPGADGVDQLRELLRGNNNTLSVPFGDARVVEYFMTKDLPTCGGTKKDLFFFEFADHLSQVKCSIRRKAQQIESGIRDLRKNQKK